jgi:hypothetical protein
MTCQMMGSISISTPTLLPPPSSAPLPPLPPSPPVSHSPASLNPQNSSRHVSSSLSSPGPIPPTTDDLSSPPLSRPSLTRPATSASRNSAGPLRDAGRGCISSGGGCKVSVGGRAWKWGSVLAFQRPMLY